MVAFAATYHLSEEEEMAIPPTSNRTYETPFVRFDDIHSA
jgi:hypothetical protein